MKRLFIFMVLFAAHYSSYAQDRDTVKTGTTETIFTPHSVTYNGSPDPRECWESVAWGIIIKTEKVNGFFSLPFQKLDELKKIIEGKTVTVEVVYYDEPFDGGGQVGSVIKITMNNEVIYTDR